MKIHCLYDKLVPISELKLNPKNRNTHPESQIKRLAQILLYQGWRYPVKVSKASGVVTSGHGRVAAALANGWANVPVNYQEYDNAAQEYADTIADNSIASWAELDIPGIKLDMNELDIDLDIDLLGIKDFTLDDIPNDKDKTESDSETKERLKKIVIPEIIEGDCLTVLKTLPNDHVDSLVTDPPAGISFMGKEWDGDKGGSKEWITWLADVMRECLRVMKPGAHGFVWAIPRTSHWTASALEHAGFEIRDVVTHLFGSGFPKSLDISKAIDKAAGAEREVIGNKGTFPRMNGGKYPSGADGKYEMGRSENNITMPCSSEAKEWQGWGTALKPASEHWILVRKPLGEKTVAANVLKHGTGGLNIDATRISLSSDENPEKLKERSGGSPGFQNEYVGGSGGGGLPPGWDNTKGRFPANLVLSHNADCISETHTFGDSTKPNYHCTPGCAVAMLDAQSGISSSPGKTVRGAGGQNGKYSAIRGQGTVECPSDSGGASRFFYCAKPSKAERNEGCDDEIKEKQGARPNSKDNSGKFPDHDHRPTGANNHPTVKPIRLMTYLITMITPPDGQVLDPFCGSGTTGVAAGRAGFKFLGIERDPEYVQIARHRFVHEMKMSDDEISESESDG